MYLVNIAGYIALKDLEFTENQIMERTTSTIKNMVSLQIPLTGEELICHQSQAVNGLFFLGFFIFITIEDKVCGR